MTPTGRRAWRKAAKRMRRKHGYRWRSPDAIWGGKRWSELVPDLGAHRVQITGAWFRRHGFSGTDEALYSRHYVGLFGSVDGDHVVMQFGPRPFTSRSLVGMTMGARKRAAFRDLRADSFAVETLVKIERTEERAKYRIGQRLRPCPGCEACSMTWFVPGNVCDGSGVLPAKRSAR